MVNYFNFNIYLLPEIHNIRAIWIVTRFQELLNIVKYTKLFVYKLGITNFFVVYLCLF